MKVISVEVTLEEILDKFGTETLTIKPRVVSEENLAVISREFNGQINWLSNKELSALAVIERQD